MNKLQPLGMQSGVALSSSSAQAVSAAAGIDADVLERHPHFARMVEALLQTTALVSGSTSAGSLGGAGIPRATHEALKRTRADADVQRQAYLEAACVYSELEAALLVQPQSSEEQRIQANAACIEAAQVVHLSPRDGRGSSSQASDDRQSTKQAEFGAKSARHSAGETLLGLSSADLAQDASDELAALNGTLVRQIEAQIQDKCSALLAFYTPVSSASGAQNSTTMAARMSAFVDGVQRDQALLQQKQDSSTNDSRPNVQMEAYFTALLQTLRTMHEMVSKHLLGSQAQFDAATSKWAAAKCEAMGLKLSVLAMQLEHDTYTPATLPALALLRDYVSTAFVESRTERDASNRMLVAYQSIGSKFTELVREYGSVLEEIENRRWALEELRRDQAPTHF
ncbi:hypothetical protein CAOG_05806 [Capsaspora owczarzaki ATCC 30864]|uniref:HAUS augmin-like complex subunit 4 n=1 Tax=Capsaspora owczarzaki (strain ATCC 30864) TaxID=595528 RepID=A0A0D2UJS0_CAPO3|nr:hypothetical protein CAOG_05806 [Capsaspora owczarzaki ATCC 30864]KJE95351.1 hypothetical protein CAOG_005806 [Capsaspora owczarzaki ATCC 30864]|eukprot:XP_004345396.2 hypothetical protein CAOG_05806 [Capsaspora owczarzaki ATCC 30864]